MQAAALTAPPPARLASGNTLIRAAEVLAQTGMKKSTLYAHMDQGLFPRAIKLGEKLAAWPADEVSKINAARIAGKSPDQIKQLVAELMIARKSRI